MKKVTKSTAKVTSSTVAVVTGITAVIVYIIYAFCVSRYQGSEIVGDIIDSDVKKLVVIFEQINNTCIISSFDYQKNPINFLNVERFTGSEVGPMNLVHPDKWEGPYVKDNLTVQSIEYQVVRTKFGYFITPGEGVVLPNGKIIGKDIILDESADILKMAGDENYLRYNNEPLAAQLSLKKMANPEMIAIAQEDEF